MGYVAKVTVRALGLGKHWEAGARIGDDELPRKLRETLLAEGVIAEVEEVEPGPEEAEPEEDGGPDLMQIEGVDEERARALVALGFHTVEAVAGASITALTALSGVGKKTARRIKEAAQEVLDDQA